MGQFRFSIYFKWQLGFLIEIDRAFLSISLPFLLILIGLQKESKGIELFGYELVIGKKEVAKRNAIRNDR